MQKVIILMHYGAFRIEENSGLESQNQLLNEWEKRMLPPERLKLLKIGDSIWL